MKTRSDYLVGAPKRRLQPPAAKAAPVRPVAFEQILHSAQGEDYYGDGAPTWLEGKAKRAPQTTADAAKAQLLAMKHLITTADADELRRAYFLNLVDILDACRPNARCLSGGCSLCTRAAQRALVSSMTKFADTSVEPLVAFSIVPDMRLREGNSIDHIRRQIGRMVLKVHRDLAGLRMIVAAFDISANESLTEAFPPHYQPQIYGVARKADWLRHEPRLRRRFGSSGAIYIPVRKRNFDGNPIVYAYTFKPNFDRRVTIPAVGGLEAGIRGISTQRQTTKSRSLRVHQDAELRMVLHELDLDRRLILIGTEITTGSRGRLAMRALR